MQVRDVGRTRQLRIDGTFASCWEPGRTATGSVWDALAAPILALPPQRRRSVLVLGLGGGSAARIARAVAPRARIVGVEIDPEVVRMAQRWFDLDALGVQVVLDDAQAFVQEDRRRFDIVLDDVFIGPASRIRKPDWLPRPGLRQMARRVAPGGLLVSNAIDEAVEVERALREIFPVTLQIGIVGYDNRILVGGPEGLDARLLRAAVAADPDLGPSVRGLRFLKVRDAQWRRKQRRELHRR